MSSRTGCCEPLCGLYARADLRLRYIGCGVFVLQIVKIHELLVYIEGDELCAGSS